MEEAKHPLKQSDDTDDPCRRADPANRILGDSPRREINGLVCDWEIPELSQPHLVTFIAEVHRQAEVSHIRFSLDIAKLPEADQERLHSILALRHAGIDTRESLLCSIAWMLTVSLRQAKSQLLVERANRSHQPINNT